MAIVIKTFSDGDNGFIKHEIGESVSFSETREKALIEAGFLKTEEKKAKGRKKKEV